MVVLKSLYYACMVLELDISVAAVFHLVESKGQS